MSIYVYLSESYSIYQRTENECDFSDRVQWLVLIRTGNLSYYITKFYRLLATTAAVPHSPILLHCENKSLSLSFASTKNFLLAALSLASSWPFLTSVDSLTLPQMLYRVRTFFVQTFTWKDTFPIDTTNPRLGRFEVFCTRFFFVANSVLYASSETFFSSSNISSSTGDCSSIDFTECFTEFPYLVG